MSPVLTVKDLHVSYSGLKVVKGVTFAVNQAEIAVILGPNGSGKSTTLRTISGIQSPERGDIKFMGLPIHNLPPHRIAELGISHVLEGKMLFPRMSVADNLKMGAYTKKARDKADETLHFVTELFPILKERRNQMAGTLSGGEQQMLAIGRGLMLNPKLLMLDEPSLGLAPKLVRIIMGVVKQIRGQGVSILLVEQNARSAIPVADSVFVFENGRVAQAATVNQFMELEEIRRTYLGE